MYRAACQSYLNHTFTINMNIRALPPDLPQAFPNALLARINSFRVIWHANEYNKGAPLRFTTCFDRAAPYGRFRTRVNLHEGDSYWRGKRMLDNALRQYHNKAWGAMEGFRLRCPPLPGSDLKSYFEAAIQDAVFDGFDEAWEQMIWWGF